MGIAANTNLVHEAEAQRQHARIKLPATLHIRLQGEKVYQLPLKDISAGGFSLENAETLLSLGSQHEAQLAFNINSVEFQIKIAFLVKTSDGKGHVGCEFQNMGPQEISTLRFMITSYLSGELVTAGDVINTLSRQNFTKGRGNKSANAGMTGFARAKALFMSLVVFLVGLGALSFIANQLYSNYFLSHAETAVIKIDTFEVSMPRDGKLHSLIPEDGIVTFGVPIASYETAMLDALKGHLDDANLSTARAAELFNQTLTGTISSPCDCVLQKQLIVDGQFAAKGATAFELAPADAKPFVEARFSFKESQNVVPGKSVNIEIPGMPQTITGRISDVTVSTTGTDLMAIIQLQESVPASFKGRPVAVVIGNLIDNEITALGAVAGLGREL